MRTSLSRWITEGTIAPWTWGTSLDAFFAIVPAAKAEIEEQLQLGYPLVRLDDVEFYFEGDEFTHLSEVIIEAWAINESDKPAYFTYDWIRSGLTFKQVKAILENIKLAYEIQRGPLGTSHILTSTGAFFGFYSDFDTEEEAELAKIYFTNRAK
ncbi:MAG: hypothetical protein ACRYFX_17220 [Janthinobacterium lividum]